MIHATEFLLKEVLNERLEQLYNKPGLIEKLFYNYAGIVEQLKKLFMKPDKIKVVMGFPRDPVQLPCYAVILGESQEQESGLGMNLDSEFLEYTDGIKNVDIELNPITLLNSENVYVQFPEIIGQINSLKQNGVDLSYEIVDEQKGIVLISTEDKLSPITANYDYEQKVFKTRGALFNNKFRIECWSNNAELTNYMYYIAKWAMLSSIDKLTSYGIILPTLSGTEYLPEPEYFPEYVFRRTLNIDLRVEDYFEEWDEAMNIRDVDVDEEFYSAEITIKTGNEGGREFT